jgi:hypothetical protein
LQVEKKLQASELQALRQALGALYYFSDENATGHYRLNMAKHFDRQLAIKILELNNDERQVCTCMYVCTCTCMYTSSSSSIASS